MLGLGFVASLAIIWVIHNYGKFKISVAIQIENATLFSDKSVTAKSYPFPQLLELTNIITVTEACSNLLYAY